MHLKFKPTSCKKKLHVVGLQRQGELLTSRRLGVFHTAQAATLSCDQSTGELHLRQTGGDQTQDRHIDASIAFSYSCQWSFALHLKMHSKYQQHSTVGLPIKYKNTGISFHFTTASGLRKPTKQINCHLFLFWQLFTKSDLLKRCLNAGSTTGLRARIKLDFFSNHSVASQGNKEPRNAETMVFNTT